MKLRVFKDLFKNMKQNVNNNVRQMKLNSKGIEPEQGHHRHGFEGRYTPEFKAKQKAYKKTKRAMRKKSIRINRVKG